MVNSDKQKKWGVVVAKNAAINAIRTLALMTVRQYFIHTGNLVVLKGKGFFLQRNTVKKPKKPHPNQKVEDIIPLPGCHQKEKSK